MRPIEDVLLPAHVGSGPHESAMLALLQALRRHFVQIAQRVNGTLPKDGTEAMTGGLTLATYTVATRPSSPDGTIIYVSDGAAGARYQARHGGAWVNLG